MLDILFSHRPPSCGPKSNTRAYLSWRAYHQQLWRFQTYHDGPIVSSPLVIPTSHTTPPRKKDKVICYGRFGVILWVNHEFNEASVRHFTDNKYEDEVYDLDLFEFNPGKIRWRIL